MRKYARVAEPGIRRGLKILGPKGLVSSNLTPGILKKSAARKSEKRRTFFAEHASGASGGGEIYSAILKIGASFVQ